MTANGACIAVFELRSHGIRLHRNDVAAAVVRDIERGDAGGGGRSVGQGDEPFLPEQLECASLVAVIRRDDDRGACRYLRHRGDAVAVGRTARSGSARRRSDPFRWRRYSC